MVTWMNGLPKGPRPKKLPHKPPAKLGCPSPRQKEGGFVNPNPEQITAPPPMPKNFGAVDPACVADIMMAKRYLGMIDNCIGAEHFKVSVGAAITLLQNSLKRMEGGE